MQKSTVLYLMLFIFAGLLILLKPVHADNINGPKWTVQNLGNLKHNGSNREISFQNYGKEYTFLVRKDITAIEVDNDFAYMLSPSKKSIVVVSYKEAPESKGQTAGLPQPFGEISIKEEFPNHQILDLSVYHNPPMTGIFISAKNSKTEKIEVKSFTVNTAGPKEEITPEAKAKIDAENPFKNKGIVAIRSKVTDNLLGDGEFTVIRDPKTNGPIILSLDSKLKRLHEYEVSPSKMGYYSNNYPLPPVSLEILKNLPDETIKIMDLSFAAKYSKEKFEKAKVSHKRYRLIQEELKKDQKTRPSFYALFRVSNMNAANTFFNISIDKTNTMMTTYIGRLRAEQSLRRASFLVDWNNKVYGNTWTKNLLFWDKISYASSLIDWLDAKMGMPGANIDKIFNSEEIKKLMAMHKVTETDVLQWAQQSGLFTEKQLIKMRNDVNSMQIKGRRWFGTVAALVAVYTIFKVRSYYTELGYKHLFSSPKQMYGVQGRLQYLTAKALRMLGFGHERIKRIIRAWNLRRARFRRRLARNAREQIQPEYLIKSIEKQFVKQGLTAKEKGRITRLWNRLFKRTTNVDDLPILTRRGVPYSHRAKNILKFWEGVEDIIKTKMRGEISILKKNPIRLAKKAKAQALRELQRLHPHIKNQSLRKRIWEFLNTPITVDGIKKAAGKLKPGKVKESIVKGKDAAKIKIKESASKFIERSAELWNFLKKEKLRGTAKHAFDKFSQWIELYVHARHLKKLKNLRKDVRQLRVLEDEIKLIFQIRNLKKFVQKTIVEHASRNGFANIPEVISDDYLTWMMIENKGLILQKTLDTSMSLTAIQLKRWRRFKELLQVTRNSKNANLYKEIGPTINRILDHLRKVNKNLDPKLIDPLTKAMKNPKISQTLFDRAVKKVIANIRKANQPIPRELMAPIRKAMKDPHLNQECKKIVNSMDDLAKRKVIFESEMPKLISKLWNIERVIGKFPYKKDVAPFFEWWARWISTPYARYFLPKKLYETQFAKNWLRGDVVNMGNGLSQQIQITGKHVKKAMIFGTCDAILDFVSQVFARQWNENPSERIFKMGKSPNHVRIFNWDGEEVGIHYDVIGNTIRLLMGWYIGMPTIYARSGASFGLTHSKPISYFNRIIDIQKKSIFRLPLNITMNMPSWMLAKWAVLSDYKRKYKDKFDPKEYARISKEISRRTFSFEGFAQRYLFGKLSDFFNTNGMYYFQAEFDKVAASIFNSKLPSLLLGSVIMPIATSLPSHYLYPEYFGYLNTTMIKILKKMNLDGILQKIDAKGNFNLNDWSEYEKRMYFYITMALHKARLKKEYVKKHKNLDGFKYDTKKIFKDFFGDNEKLDPEKGDKFWHGKLIKENGGKLPEWARGRRKFFITESAAKEINKIRANRPVEYSTVSNNAGLYFNNNYSKEFLEAVTAVEKRTAFLPFVHKENENFFPVRCKSVDKYHARSMIFQKLLNEASYLNHSVVELLNALKENNDTMKNLQKLSFRINLVDTLMLSYSFFLDGMVSKKLKIGISNISGSIYRILKKAGFGYLLASAPAILWAQDQQNAHLRIHNDLHQALRELQELLFQATNEVVTYFVVNNFKESGFVEYANKQIKKLHGVTFRDMKEKRLKERLLQKDGFTAHELDTLVMIAKQRYYLKKLLQKGDNQDEILKKIEELKIKGILIVKQALHERGISSETFRDLKDYLKLKVDLIKRPKVDTAQLEKQLNKELKKLQDYRNQLVESKKLFEKELRNVYQDHNHLRSGGTFRLWRLNNFVATWSPGGAVGFGAWWLFRNTLFAESTGWIAKTTDKYVPSLFKLSILTFVFCRNLKAEYHNRFNLLTMDLFGFFNSYVSYSAQLVLVDTAIAAIENGGEVPKDMATLVKTVLENDKLYNETFEYAKILKRELEEK